MRTQARKLRAAVDPGHSWGNILRFADISFAEGGEFKLCFCDSSLLGANEICDSAEDFTIEVRSPAFVGTIALFWVW